MIKKSVAPFLALVFLLGSAFFPSGIVNAAGIIHVPGIHLTIQDAIDHALAGDTIMVAAGTYFENITLKDGVNVIGAGADVTIIDGGTIGPVIPGPVVIANSIGPTTKLEGFTLTHGYAAYGGGMYNSNSSPTVINCIFLNNYTEGKGGGMYNSNSSPTVINCIFLGNESVNNGGGMANWNSSPILINCIFSGNGGHIGGGMWNNGSSQTLVNCTFSGNGAHVVGGVWSQNCVTTLINCILWGNSGTWSNEMYNDNAEFNVSYCDINQGVSGGTGNICADPLFVDTYLHLSSNSPCINAGDNDAVPADTYDLDSDGDTTEKLPFDLDGNPRILNAVVDMGAYETPSNVPPVANDDIATTTEDTPVTISVLVNDSDPDLDHLGITTVSDPAHGTAVLNADDTVTYTPDADYFGADTFTYTISDGNGGSDVANVHVTVNPTAPAMHIASITILLSQKGPNWEAQALVQIVDEVGNPVRRARVVGDWTGAVSSTSATGTTNGKGEARVNSGKVKAQSDQSFTFTVTHVSHLNYTYSLAQNEETSDSAIVP